MAPRARPIAIAAACWLLLLAGGARAVDGDGSVGIQDFQFTDAVSGNSTTTIPVGATVVWHWNGPGVNHSVTSDTGSFDSNPTASPTTPTNHKAGDTFMVTFSTAGTFTYYCRVHPNTMHGTIVVVAPGGGGGGGGGGGNGPPPPPPPASLTPDHTAPAFNALREKGKKIVFKLSEAAKVTIKIRRGHKLVKTFHVSAKKGSNTFRLTHRGLKAGVRYKALVSAVDKAGNKSHAKSVSVRI
jgi:plastocyanin